MLILCQSNSKLVLLSLISTRFYKTKGLNRNLNNIGAQSHEYRSTHTLAQNQCKIANWHNGQKSELSIQPLIDHQDTRSMFPQLQNALSSFLHSDTHKCTAHEKLEGVLLYCVSLCTYMKTDLQMLHWNSCIFYPLPKIHKRANISYLFQHWHYYNSDIWLFHP